MPAPPTSKLAAALDRKLLTFLDGKPGTPLITGNGEGGPDHSGDKDGRPG
jgi:hypothetical protein